ncbi:MAG: tRNA uridine-5-carboxymethylaminomethyl(34) synthesis enzyme MnmG [Clostridia bacterium]|nr:tRNA uridine-5-carboxymethylaminomethyl(34) synthesis enzyme MnmG [Clostridia bacterium]
MQLYPAGKYDVIVIGGGHAGCEAGLASARLGAKTALFAINLDSIANMPCNPNIGGTAKGHLVREIDALGGEMGKMADKTFIQSRMLNVGKGPAVHSLRAQIDRNAYSREMKHYLELTENLDVRQGEITEILFNDDKSVKGVVSHTGGLYECKCVIIATGTYLKGKIIIGEVSYSGGPDGMFAANSLSDCLRNAGIELMRFKTGTPARIRRSSVDFSVMEEQTGDENITPFSFGTNPEGLENIVSCHLTYTSTTTHDIIKKNLHRSPLYSGMIEGVGPRYCPSIEDKVVRFADKERHQLFIEPMGLHTEEMYVQGFSSSLPEEVQMEMLHSVKGLENAKVMRIAYAIEYDCVNPLQLKPTLEFKDYGGLFGAGQFNGSSGYEEAAAQGLIAGINAAHIVLGKEPFTLQRSDAYIGTLIDDLVTKGTQEPYRMMTSRSEYRLALRQDNADERLTEKGYNLGLISQERYEKFIDKYKKVELEINRLSSTVLSPTEGLNNFLESKGTSAVKTGLRLSDMLRRPEIHYKDLKEVCDMPQLEADVCEQVEIKIKYDGYIKRQLDQIEQFRRLEAKLMPEDTDYNAISGLRLEARQKLSQMRPQSLGQASRISGVSPSDIAVLLVYLEQRGLK